MVDCCDVQGFTVTVNSEFYSLQFCTVYFLQCTVVFFVLFLLHLPLYGPLSALTVVGLEGLIKVYLVLF